jgi:hypothetical protein
MTKKAVSPTKPASTLSLRNPREIPNIFFSPEVLQQNMKLCHAAALALVGWYLMLPPVTHPWMSDARHWINPQFPIMDKCTPTAPLSQWTQYRAYERVSDCEAEQLKAQDDLKEINKAIDDAGAPQFKKGKLWEHEKLREQEEIRCADPALTRCIASDDPRLAK